ncbi:MAG TPA: DUF128 domain-containing protein [Candidatus Syntrophoarchaeum butanivorans]|uniref:DUF128 domain-containing protein n=1 Tax=Candidatus Syntropharchaeum butanivorans TaxID=1839936 RepID=A0A1F2P4H4_9EURY|nr:MAG: protein containing DUF128 [Candidatus Syntrophoarchaeum butanivorans]HEC57733.1 DUF128 domain-containing protein [Candidatus Syntrophoarchaeum butanivorans]
MREISVQRKVIEILRILSEARGPIGARRISDLLNERGYNLGERAVRYHLNLLDRHGFTKKHGYLGRTITELGRRELEEALVTDRLNFVMTRIESLIYHTTFNPETCDGDVVVNISMIDKDRVDDAMRMLGEVASSRINVPPYVAVADEGKLICGEFVPRGNLGVATLCSITVDGLLLARGIPSRLKHGGLVRIEKGEYRGFVEFVGYRGTTIDPIRIFLSKRMTDISGAIRGDGLVLANFREVPEVARDKVEQVLAELSRLKFGEWIYEPGGVVLYAGVNGIAYLEENGIETDTRPNAALMPFSEMKEV